MARRLDFKIIEAHTADEFQTKVQENLNGGWEIAGQFSIQHHLRNIKQLQSANESEWHVHYTITMVKDK